MKLYQTIDGTMIGFYQEQGAEVQALLYREVYEQMLVTKTREVEKIIPGYFEKKETVIPGYFDERQIYIQGHYERQMIWKPAYYVTRYREVPGHYEIQNIWVPAYTVQRSRIVPGYWEPYEVTRPADPVTGRIEVTYTQYRWIPEHSELYDEVIPAGFKDQRVWIETYTEEYQELIPTGESMGRVWIEGHFEPEKFWVPETIKTEQVWVPPKTEIVIEEYEELADVMTGWEPVYEMVDPERDRVFEVLELVEAPADRPDLEDSITIRNMETGEVLTTTAYYMGLAEKIDENEYVIPQR